MTWTAEPAKAIDPDAVEVLFRYFHELSTRYFGRPVPPAEVAQYMREEPSDDLVPPHGLFLLGRLDGQPAGCVGVRVLSPEVTELTRMFVDRPARGSGGAGLLLRAAEDAARGFGARSMRLTTRDDLVEARAFYTRNGYRPIPPYGDDPYAEHWFGKRL